MDYKYKDEIAVLFWLEKYNKYDFSLQVSQLVILFRSEIVNLQRASKYILFCQKDKIWRNNTSLFYVLNSHLSDKLFPLFGVHLRILTSRFFSYFGRNIFKKEPYPAKIKSRI